jgi:hypothetical protein
MNNTIKNIDYSRPAGYIPEVMNALFNDEVFESTDLKEMRDAFRVKQMQGKSWLLNAVEQYCYKDDKILVIGSWFGFTSFCLWKMGFNNITEVDPDARLEKFANHLNRFNKNFAHLTADVNDILLDYDVIINPSSEHIADHSWFTCIPQGALVIIHSTDYPSDDHPNTCNTLEETKEKYPLDYKFCQTLDLDYYKRFMIIGKKQ